MLTCDQMYLICLDLDIFHDILIDDRFVFWYKSKKMNIHNINYFFNISD